MLACADSRALARSAAEAWAAAESLSTWRRMRPHRSISQLKPGPALNWPTLPELALTTVPWMARLEPLPLPLWV